MLREYWNFCEGGLLCTKQAASSVYSVLRSVALQNTLCWLAYFVHNRPPSPKFQILPSQLRLTADRASGLSIKGLRSQPQSSDSDRKSSTNNHWEEINWLSVCPNLTYSDIISQILYNWIYQPNLWWVIWFCVCLTIFSPQVRLSVLPIYVFVEFCCFLTDHHRGLD